MPDPTDTDALAEELRLAYDTDTWPYAARIVLTSDWLARRDAAVGARALREAARYFEYEMAPAWGGDATWLSTGNRVADLIGETLRDRAAALTEGDDHDR